MAETVVILNIGGADTWTVPADWNDDNNTIEVIGAGGGGSGNAAGGGGGAYSAIANLTLTPSASIDYTVGVFGAGGNTADVAGAAGGDTWFNGASLGAS